MLSSLRTALVIPLFAVCFFIMQNAVAQERGRERPGDPIRALESRVSHLEGVLRSLHQRVSDLEYNQRPEPYPGPALQEVACLIIDTGYSKAFLGKGRVKIEAEAEARQACGKEIHASYCQGAVKCSDPRQVRPGQGSVCMITDTGYSKTFKGEGLSLIEAEFNARKACQASVHASYCVGAVRCDSF